MKNKKEEKDKNKKNSKNKTNKKKRNIRECQPSHHNQPRNTKRRVFSCHPPVPFVSKIYPNLARSAGRQVDHKQRFWGDVNQRGSAGRP